MNKRLICIVILLGQLLVPLFTCAQANDIDFLVDKIRRNYPGFNDKTDSARFGAFVKSILSAKSLDTFRALSEITNYFEDKHLQVYQTKESMPVDYTVCKADLTVLTHYLNSEQQKKNYEGYWINDYENCIIGIRQVSAYPLTLKAWVVESRDSLLPPGRVLSVFRKTGKGTFMTDQINSWSKARYYVKSIFRNDTVFTIGAESKWKKLRSYGGGSLCTRPVFNEYTTGGSLSNNVFLMKIPGATQRDATIIDSLVRSQHDVICRSSTLILDLTNNLGGRSYVYAPLWPFIYSGPIARHQTLSYCTEDNIAELSKAVEEYAKMPNADTQVIAQWHTRIAMLRDSLGRFVSNGVDSIKLDTILEYPRNVAIIMNYACQSATELMILMCRQSKKVKLFGEHTMGAVDYLDYSPTVLPSKKYKLYIATSRRAIPENQGKLDGIGIYPDIPIADTVPNWQQFVVRYYESH